MKFILTVTGVTLPITGAFMQACCAVCLFWCDGELSLWCVYALTEGQGADFCWDGRA